MQVEEAPKPKPVPVKKKPKFEEGRSRKFADEESRRVYEESIKRAEGAKIEYKPDEHFASSKLRSSFENIEEEEESPLVSEVRDMLSTPESARQAIVLQQILNRKY